MEWLSFTQILKKPNFQSHCFKLPIAYFAYASQKRNRIAKQLKKSNACFFVKLAFAFSKLIPLSS